MYKDLIINLAIIVSFLAISGEIFKESPIRSTRKRQILCGILSGGLGILLMLFSIKVTDTTILDMRNFTIIISVLYGGLISGVITAIICSIGRVALYGLNEAALIAILTFISITIICAVISRMQASSFKKFMAMTIASVMITFGALTYLIKNPEILKFSLIYYGLISIIGGLLVYYITHYVSQSNENFRKLRMFEKVIETTGQGVSITDTSGSILFINKGFTSITGYTSEDVIGRNPSMLKSGKHDATFYRKMWADINNTGHWSGEIWDKNKSGTIFPELLNISEVKDKYGKTINYVSVFSDITDLKETERKLQETNARLEKISALDGLTGIPNRRTFDTVLEKEWNRALRNNQPLSVILFDVDFFKKYNDSYGHLEGDECLKRVASTLAETIERSTDLVARYGGEEFAIILPETNAEGARLIAEKVRRNINDLQIPHLQSDIDQYVTISLGVSTLVPHRDMKPNQLIDFADQALYLAKANGRNVVRVYP